MGRIARFFKSLLYPVLHGEPEKLPSSGIPYPPLKCSVISHRAKEILKMMDDRKVSSWLGSQIETSIRNQLIYIADIEEGRRSDLEKIKTFTIEHWNLREVEEGEPPDDDLLSVRINNLLDLFYRKYGYPQAAYFIDFE